MIEEVKRAGEAALERVGQAATADEVRALETELLGKRGPFATFKTGLGSLATVEEKRAAGQAVNEATVAVAAGLDQRRRELASAERVVQLAAERLDLTEVMPRPRRGHAHVVTQAWERLEDVFIGLGFQVAEGPMSRPTGTTSRRSTCRPTIRRAACTTRFYLDCGEPGSTVLRTHTSPVQIRVMQTQPPPIYMVMPGRVFRNETTDATHLPCSTSSKASSSTAVSRSADLAGTIDAFTKAFFGAGFTAGCGRATSRSPSRRPSSTSRPLPATWLELGGCGMVHPNVLRAGGLDPEEWSGFAFGFGIDRMAKERHAIGDVREMYSNDLRFVEQF